MAPDFIERLKASARHQLCLPLLYHLSMPDPSPSTLTVLNSLLTARKKEWWTATADNLPQAVTCQHCDTHYVIGNRTHNLPIVSPRYQLCYGDRR